MSPRTISCRIPQELSEALEEICKEKGLTITEAITIGLQNVCEGKIPLTPMRGRVVHCLICGFTLYPSFPEEGKYILWACPKCGYRGRTEEPEWRTIQDFEISK